MMSERIKSRRKELKLTQLEVAEFVGVSKTAISLWESGTNDPNGKNLDSLCIALKCDQSWLLYGTGTPIRAGVKSERLQVIDLYAGVGPTDHSVREDVGTFELWDSKTPLRDDEVELPFFKEVELSAGNGSSVVKENTGFKLRFAKSTLKRQGVSAEHAACVVVSGNSMQPVLPDKATVGIDTANTKVKDGEMYAVDHDGLLRVKILYRLPGGGYRLRSYNRDEYPDEDISVHQAEKLKVLGKVFWYSVLI
jgi:phage repressor protein C with HTH and peptisase S24 domain